MKRDVPQESILGLGFCLYMNDLPDVIENPGRQMHIDDVQIYKNFKFCDVHRCVDNINSDLSKVDKWTTENDLCINPDKSKCILTVAAFHYCYKNI